MDKGAPPFTAASRWPGVGLLDDGFDGGLFEVGGIAEAAQDAADGDAHFLVPLVEAPPVHAGVFADGGHEGGGDGAQLFVAEDFDCAHVVGEGVVEGDFFGCQAVFRFPSNPVLICRKDVDSARRILQFGRNGI